MLVIGALLLIPPIEVALLRFINPPRTRPMVFYRVGAVFSRTADAPLRYAWVSLPQIPEMFLKHLWVSEDQRFFQHDGFDWKELDAAVEQAGRRGTSLYQMPCAEQRAAREAYGTVCPERDRTIAASPLLIVPSAL